MIEQARHYDNWLAKLVIQGVPDDLAFVTVIHRYLDGKPTTWLSSYERDEAFWTS